MIGKHDGERQSPIEASPSYIQPVYKIEHVRCTLQLARPAMSSSNNQSSQETNATYEARLQALQCKEQALLLESDRLKAEFAKEKAAGAKEKKESERVRGEIAKAKTELKDERAWIVLKRDDFRKQREAGTITAEELEEKEKKLDAAEAEMKAVLDDDNVASVTD